LQWQWIGEIVEITLTWDEVTGRLEALHRAPARQRCQDRNRAAPVGYFDRLAGFHAPEKLTRSLSQLPHSDAGHVLVVAHQEAAVSPSWAATCPGAK
jgi:hypothetical protein